MKRISDEFLFNQVTFVTLNAILLKKNERAAFLQLMVSKTCNGELSDQEKKELKQWRTQSTENDVDFQQGVYDKCGCWIGPVELDPNYSGKDWKEFIRGKNNLVPLKQSKIIYIVYRVAACYLVIHCVFAIRTLLFRPPKYPGLNSYAYIKVNEQLNDPEYNVQLQLTDGTCVYPYKKNNNRLPNQGGCRLLLSDKTISYVQDSTAIQQGKSFNSVSTFYGKHYKVELPDGSRVWLNATSSIRFPVSNYSRKRTVELTGEAFFEIKPIYSGKTKIPFIVYVKSPTGLKQEVAVTGTAFNINAYGDEPVIKTNLLEGRVTVTSEGNKIALQPGEELQLSKDKRIILSHVSMEEAMAWKNDSFVFINKPVAIVLKEIERWYGLSLKLEGNTSSEIKIKIPRSTDLSGLLKMIDHQVEPLNGKK